MAFLFAWAACRGSPPQNHGYFARPVVEKAAWKVFDGDRQIGWLRQLEIHDVVVEIGFATAGGDGQQLLPGCVHEHGTEIADFGGDVDAGHTAI